MMNFCETDHLAKVFFRYRTLSGSSECSSVTPGGGVTSVSPHTAVELMLTW